MPTPKVAMSRKRHHEKKPSKKLHCFDMHLVSESTGSLARHLASVAMSQFPNLRYQLYEYPFCTGVAVLREAQATIETTSAPHVFSALTSRRLQRSLAIWCTRKRIPHHQLVHSLVEFVEEQTGYRSVRDAKQVHRCNDDYFRRIDAWEFTLQHDDSRRLESIGEADLILLGVSRVGKTPLAAYLGSQGYRVANISLARETTVPHLLREHRNKTVGLTLDAHQLAAIRKRRFELNRLAYTRAGNTYFSPKSAFEDVQFAEKLFRKLGVRSLDMTNLTVEEAAARVLSLIQRDLN